MTIFNEFLGKDVKCCYLDFDQQKIARGKLEQLDSDLIKISGKLGVIIINKKVIQKMGMLK